MKKITLFWCFVVLFALSMGFLFAAGEMDSTGPTPENPIVLKGGHTGTPENMMHKTLEYWAELVEERTDGAVLIEVYPSEQLGNERTLIENTNLGTIEWCLSGSGGVASFAPEFGMFENAFTFSSLKHFENVCFNREFMDELSGNLESKSSLTLLGFQWLGNRSVIANRAVTSPSDAEGMKLRVPDVPSYKVVAYAVGAIANPLPFGEVYMALKQGVVDGAEGTPENMINMKFVEVADYYTLTNHMIQASAVYMNKNTFYNQLSKTQQSIVRDSAYEAWYWFFNQNEKIQSDFLQQIRDIGVNVIEPTNAQMKVFMDRAEEKLKNDYIPTWGDTWDKFRALAE